VHEVYFKHNPKDKSDRTDILIDLDKENKTQPNDGMTRRDSMNKKAII
jgi:hypothetical protein